MSQYQGESSTANLSRLVYVSEAVRPLTEVELHRIVERSHVHNQAAGITGLLLAGGGHFLQVLEGELEVVAERFDVIRADARHRSVQRMLFEAAPQRMFPSWWMGMLDVDKTTPVDRQRLAETVRLGRASRGPGGGGRSRDAVIATLREFKAQLLIRSA